MANEKKKDDNCSTGACEKKTTEGNKLVKSVDLPLVGNPYPPKDVIQNETPSPLELKISSIRSALQPYLSPIRSAYSKTSDVISIGAAHSQSAIQNLSGNRIDMFKAALFTSTCLFGYLVVRRRGGRFKKLLYLSSLAGGSMAAIYPAEAKENAEFAWFMVKDKFPALAAEQYKRFSSAATPSKTTEDAPKTK